MKKLLSTIAQVMMTAFMALRALNKFPKNLLIRAINHPMYAMLSVEVQTSAQRLPMTTASSVGPSSATSSHALPISANQSAAPMCQLCQVRMTTRVNRTDLSTFWGCSNFPTCRVTARWSPTDTLPSRESCPHENSTGRTVRTYGAGKAGRFATCSLCSRRWRFQNDQWIVSDKAVAKAGLASLPWPPPSSPAYSSQEWTQLHSAQPTGEESSQLPVRPKTRTEAGKRAFSSESQPMQVESFDLTAEDGEFTWIEDE